MSITPMGLKPTINGTVMGWNSKLACLLPGHDVPGDLETGGKQDRPALPRGIVPSAVSCPSHTDVRFEETQINTVSHDRNTYDGTYDTRYLDANGNLACADSGTLHATRLSVDQSNTTASK